LVFGSLFLALGTGCAELQDRQVLNPGRDWRISDARRERVARLKAPFVSLGNRLKSIAEPKGPPTLSIQPLEEPESSAVTP
jgi:hypothetical protein